MHCPFCNTPDTKVIDSRLAAGGTQIRRRRQCHNCGDRFTSFEVIELVMPRVIKSNGRIEPYDGEKLKRSIMLSLRKRPVSSDDTDTAISKIEKTLRQLGEREVTSQRIGEEVIQALKDLDPVAYVRFASVYRDFKDIAAFKQELEGMDKPTTYTDADADS